MSGVAKVSLAGKASAGGGNSIGQVTGDITTPAATAPNQSVPATLAAVGTAETVGDATHYPIVTTDAKGRVTAMSAQAVGLTFDSGSLGADISLAQNTLTNVFTTATLAVGTWVIDASILVNITTAGESVDFEIIAGSATATFSGCSATSVGYTSAIGGGALPNAALTCIVTVTVAGTILINAEMAGAATASTIKHLTQTQLFPNASGYTALKIA